MSAHLPGAQDSSGQAELQPSTPPHRKAGLANPCTAGCRDCGLFREEGKEMCGRKTTEAVSMLQVRSDS